MIKQSLICDLCKKVISNEKLFYLPWFHLKPIAWKVNFILNTEEYSFDLCNKCKKDILDLIKREE